jgi:hypothetical protein
MARLLRYSKRSNRDHLSIFRPTAQRRQTQLAGEKYAVSIPYAISEFHMKTANFRELCKKFFNKIV